MSIGSIEKLLTKDCDRSEKITCPCCQKEVALRLFESTDYSLIAAFTGKEKETYFAVCPLCASVFSVNENYMKERNSGTFCTITESDIKILHKGKMHD